MPKCWTLPQPCLISRAKLKVNRIIKKKDSYLLILHIHGDAVVLYMFVYCKHSLPLTHFFYGVVYPGLWGTGPASWDLPSTPSSCPYFDFQYVVLSPQMAEELTFPGLMVLARPQGSGVWRGQKLENNVIEYLIGPWCAGHWEDCCRNVCAPSPPPLPCLIFVWLQVMI